MRRKAKKIDGIKRLILVGVGIILQLIILALIVISLRQYAIYIYILLEAAGILQVLLLIDRNKNAAFTNSWMVIILILPVFGYALYLLWGRSATNSRKSNSIRKILSTGSKYFEFNTAVSQELYQTYEDQKKISVYLGREGFPLYKNTTCRYFPLGELQYKEMIEDMERAQHFIFLEYFIISRGELWDRVHKVLKKKAQEGVEIRLLYDDLGSIWQLPENFIKTLTDENIKVLPFNPVYNQTLRFYFNFRNHQKIVVIDGKVGYTGGTNIADEYVNIYKRYGHWKDTAIRLEGDAVWSLTVTFLQMWESESNIGEDYTKYKIVTAVEGDGFYQPFNDGPVNHPHNPAEKTYRQMIYSARQYVYITTPYLVIDEQLMDDLCLAAESDVDVRIITPKTPDHWYVHMITRLNYGKLLRAGVRIFEYSPGYIHAKTIISDDINAITGSINLDYRSFYLHFENGVWICGAPMLKDIKKDIEDTMTICEEIFFEDWEKRPWNIKFWQFILRLFVPLL